MRIMENIQKVLVIVNPISGDIEKKPIIDEIISHLNQRKITSEVFETTGNDDPKKIKDILQTQNYERVFVLGGDGTLTMVAEILADKNIPMAIFPTGSANGLAKNLDISDDLHEQINVALGQNILHIDILDVDGQTCLHISDFGLNAELIKNYEASAIRGKMGYLIQSLPTIWQSKYPFDFTINFEDKELHRSGVFLAFANAQMYGTGASVNPDAKMDDGVFELLIFKDLDVKEILKTLSNEIEFNPQVVEIFPVSKAKVTCHQPVSFQIDGEYYGEKTEIEAQISGKTIKVLIP